MTENKETKKLSAYRIFRVILFITPLFILLFLLNNYFAFTGEVKVRYDFENPNTYLVFDNEDEIIKYEDIRGGFHARFKDNDILFYLTPPVAFEKVRFKIRYKNEGFPTLLLEGVGKVGAENQVVALISEKLDNLIWSKIEEGGIILWQKEKQFKSLEEFYDNLPEADKIASFNLNLKGLKPIKDPEKINLDDYKYIIAKYEKPQVDYSWFISEADFDLKELFVKDGNFYFHLKAPSSLSRDAYLEIDYIELILSKEPLSFENLVSKIKSFFNK